MHWFLSKDLRSDRRLWISTSVAVFIILGFTDFDGKGTANSDLPPLFFALVEMLRPSHWLRDAPGNDSLLLVRVLSELLLVGFLLVAVLFVSACVGWLLQFLLLPLLPPRAIRRTVVFPMPETSVWPRIGIIRLVLAAYGAAAAVFGAIVSGLSGLQFWLLWFLYDHTHQALTGSHTWSSFHSVLLLLTACCLNAVLSSLLARRINSAELSVRLTALMLLVLQMATLALSSNILDLQMFS
jgi:hypothetical protein